MPFYLIVNSVWRDAADILVTDTSDVSAAEDTGKLIFTGGPRHLFWQQAAMQARRFVYVAAGGGVAGGLDTAAKRRRAAGVMPFPGTPNTATERAQVARFYLPEAGSSTTGTLDFDSFVMTRADRHASKGFGLHYWSDYPATKTDIVTTGSWSTTLVGARSQDYVSVGNSVSNAEAVGVSLTSTDYNKKVSQLYFGTSFQFDTIIGSPRIVPQWTTLVVKRQNYLIQEAAQITFGDLAFSEIQTIETLYRLRDEPVFFYDSAGKIFADKLWHCLITDFSVQPYHNDQLAVSMTLSRLREYAA